MTSAAGHSRFCLKEQKKQSVYQVLEGHTHLSVLLEAGKQIGRTIQMWNPSI